MVQGHIRFMVKGNLWFMVHGSRLMIMTQDERWNKRYQEVRTFIETNKRNPSKHRIEEHDMLNWVKQQRKLKNKGELKAERAEMLERLLSL